MLRERFSLSLKSSCSDCSSSLLGKGTQEQAALRSRTWQGVGQVPEAVVSEDLNLWALLALFKRIDGVHLWARSGAPTRAVISRSGECPQPDPEGSRCSRGHRPPLRQWHPLGRWWLSALVRGLGLSAGACALETRRQTRPVGSVEFKSKAQVSFARGWQLRRRSG